MRIEILNSDLNHPVNFYLKKFMDDYKKTHSVSLLRKAAHLGSGEILFLISCEEKVDQDILNKFEKCLVIHASDLPAGRGWSPHIWEIIGGASKITLSLLAASKEIDGGDVFCKQVVEIPRTALWDEINHFLFMAEINMMKFAVENFDQLNPVRQDAQISPTYYRKRAPSDSEIDPKKSIEDQFNLIRVCDPDRFPAFFELNGTKYKIILEKI